MRGRKHSVEEVLRQLRNKKDCFILGQSRTIQILDGTETNRDNDLGNKTWGKIDFLVNHCGYRIAWVGKFVKDDEELSLLNVVIDTLKSITNRLFKK